MHTQNEDEILWNENVKIDNRIQFIPSLCLISNEKI